MKCRSFLFAFLTAFTTLTSFGNAQTVAPQPPVGSNCIAPDYSRSVQIPWFLGLHPSDDLLTAFCRIQQIPGDVRFNIMFPTYQVHRSWDTSFEGQHLPATQIVRLVQSVLPMTDGAAKDENGMEFHRVLKSVVQLQAASTPSGRDLGFAPEHPAAKELVLWEPIILRVKPIVMAGQEFTMTVVLKPNLGLLALGLQGKATDVRFKGWKGRMEMGGMFGKGCSDAIPACKDLPESPIFHAPWLVSSVSLDASGTNMSNTAVAILDRLAAYKGSRSHTKSFNPATGEGLLITDDTMSKLEMRAKGSPGGTTKIQIKWEPTDNPMSVEKQLRKISDEYKIGTAKVEKTTTAPDILNKL